MHYPEFAEKCTAFLEAERPFVFLIDFEKENWHLFSQKEATEAGLFYNIKGTTNATPPADAHAIGVHLEIDSEIKTELLQRYQKAFEGVTKEINWGNSFLLNLTFPVEVDLQGRLEQVFWQSKAPFKLYWKDRFTVFSPESFIRIHNQEVETFPMKGTRSAHSKEAADELLADYKEQAEHATIVDLLRNDLSQFAQKVRVEKYRYLEEIKRPQGGLWQTSSHIKAELPQDWKIHFGDYLNRLLPAGSVSGAPKPQTLEIIRREEGQKRGFYTGVFGLYDGKTIESAVAIRYIENQNNRLYYRAGGGITHLSQCEHEFDELLQKVYIPTL